MTATDNILNAKILVVDDLEVNVRLLEGMLRVAGYTSVHSTTDPRRVYEMHREHRYGLILLDLQMPGMDGFEVMEALKAIEIDGYLPVLVITAQSAHKLRALDAGAKDFVSKPFDMAELRARVRNILEIRLYSEELASTIRALEAARETLRIQALNEERVREQELSLAQKTQESLLPCELPSFENFEIAAYSQPTRYVGGDFYDFLPLSAGNWMGVLADVSGKGMPAALLSAMVLGAHSSEFRSGAPQEQALHRVNKLLCEKSMPAQFVTLFQFLLNSEGEGEFISAAHNPAYLRRAATGQLEELVSTSYFLGMFDFASWASRKFQIGPGDILVVYSDGLTDAENPMQEVFGEARLKEVIRRNNTCGSVRGGILTALEEFTGGTSQNDDITFLVVLKTR